MERLLIVKNKILVGLDGVALKNNEPGRTEEDLTVAKVLVNCCLTPPAAGAQPYSGAKTIARYEGAVRLSRAAADEDVELPLDLVVDLKNDVLRLYAPIIGGQLLPILEGQN